MSEKQGEKLPELELELPAELLEDFRLRAVRWQGGDTADLEAFLDERLLIHLQILDYIARNPPPGRGGASATLGALREYREIADSLFEAIHRKRLLERGAPTAAPKRKR